MEATVEVPKSTANAETISEHKAIREAQKAGKPLMEKVPTADVKTEAKTAAEPSAPETAKPEASEASTSESAGVSETPPSQDKKEPKPKRDDAADRVKALLDERKERDRRIAELEARLNELSKPKTEQPKVEAKPEDPEPDFDEYLAKAPEGESMGKTMARFNRDHLGWLNRQNEKTTQQKQAQEAWSAKINAAAAKHGADVVAAAVGSQDPKSGVQLPGQWVQVLRQLDNDIDVIVHLHQNPEEYQRIMGLTPGKQLAEIVLLSHKLANPPASPKPEAVSVSRVAPPPRTVGGTAPPEPKSTAEAQSMAEHKRLRLQHRAS